MRHARATAAFTLIELLIIIGIMGILLQMLLPAVEAAREAARSAQCQNNLRQIGLALQSHHTSHQRFPSGGWATSWVGEPELGTGPEQPGSWIFNSLDYLEQRNLRRLGDGLTGLERADAFRQRCATAIRIFNCPSRRLSRAYPQTDTKQPFTKGGQLELEIVRGAKTDYAACIGSRYSFTYFSGFGWTSPETYEDWVDPSLVWPTDPDYLTPNGNAVEFDGIIHGRSRVSFKHISDGASRTYLIGEKSLHHKHYKLGTNGKGDDENMYAGYGRDTCRTASAVPVPDTEKRPGRFGSAHPTGTHMAFADGSVHRISFEIDVEVQQALGSRDGEELVDPREY